jgi:hypothetical protein
MFRLQTRAILFLGILLFGVGAVVEFSAGSLATRWQRVGPDAWGGTTDPATERAYQVVGLAVLVFGLLLAGMAAWRWLSERPRAV